MRAIRILALLSLAAACTGSGTAGVQTPESRVVTPRVLGIRADPPDVYPGNETALTAQVGDFLSDTVGYSYVWIFCDPVGASSSACISEQAQTNIANLLSGTVSGIHIVVQERDETFNAQATYLAPSIALDGLALGSPARLQGVEAIVLIVLYQGYYTQGEFDRSSVLDVALKRVRIIDPSMKPNQNPSIDRVMSDAGAVELINSSIMLGDAGPVTTALLPNDILVGNATRGSAETYIDIADDGTRTTHTETLVFSWYITSAGEFPTVPSWLPARTYDGIPLDVTATGPLTLYVLLRDNRGGIDFTSYSLTEQ
jgi:hypothetical protein